MALVGRDPELGLIASFLDRAAAGGGTLLFTGEPGVGKTALLDAAEEAAVGERLYLSHRTVAAHLYQIFPRLGITSRAALRDALDAMDRHDADRQSD